MGLGDLIQKVHGNETLSAEIDQFLMKLEAKPSKRAFGWHPSEFVGMCPRRYVLSVLTKYQRDPIPPTLRRIFDVGTGIHWTYQNVYFGPMGILWGKWKCLKCGDERWGLMPDGDWDCGDHMAGTSGPHRWEYKEVPLRAPLPGGFKKPIVGHSDGILQFNGKWHVLEIKSINDQGFTWMKKARIGHVAQAQIYSELIRQGFLDSDVSLEVPEVSDILILYVNKDKSLERIWPIEFDREAAKSELKRPHEAEVAFRDRVFPERLPECKNMLKKPAKECPLVSYCFGGKSFEQLSR